MPDLNTLSIEAPAFFEQNDIDIRCPHCKGMGERPMGIEKAKIEVFRPTHKQVEASGVAFGEDCYRIVGIEAFEGEVFVTEEEAREYLEDDNNWDLCDKEECSECHGSGQMDIMWNTIWNTGFSDHNLKGTKEIGPVAIFTHDGFVWFGLMGCGQDLSPSLCAAWIKMFPDCEWIPTEWISNTNLAGGYYHNEVGEKMGDKIVELYKKTLESTIRKAKYDLEWLNKYIASRAATA